jgi:hypothetical protein
MPGSFPRLSRVIIRVLEIAGAGCASAYAAVLLGNTHEPRAAQQPPAVVRLAPADEEMIRHVREESVALAEQLRSAADSRNNAAPAAPAAATPAAKATREAAKPITVAPVPTTRREQKPNRLTSESRQRPAEPPVTQYLAPLPRPEPMRPLPSASTSAPTSAPAEVKDPRMSSLAASSVEGATPAVPAQVPAQVPTQVPSRLFSDAASSERDAPRPPLAVGPSVSSSM